jgi:dihydropyrimidinase
VYGEALAGHLVIDDSVYQSDDLTTRRAMMSRRSAASTTRRRCGMACKRRHLHTTATDHCTFCAEQKAAGKQDFTKSRTAAAASRSAWRWCGMRASIPAC